MSHSIKLQYGPRTSIGNGIHTVDILAPNGQTLGSLSRENYPGETWEVEMDYSFHGIPSHTPVDTGETRLPAAKKFIQAAVNKQVN